MVGQVDHQELDVAGAVGRGVLEAEQVTGVPPIELRRHGAAHPERIEAFELWLADARALTDELDTMGIHDRALRDLRARVETRLASRAPKR